MNYLLDTHTFLWAVSDTKNLSKKVMEIIKNPKNNIYVSAVTLWEISIKVRIKKLNIDTLEPEDLISLSEQMDFELISLTPEESISYHNLLDDTHKDPFDRMLAWQSISRNMKLISKDRELKKFIKYGVKILW